jgi:hypothetical protein
VDRYGPDAHPDQWSADLMFPAYLPSVDRVIEEYPSLILLEALRDGRVTVYGIPVAGSDVEAIEPFRWIGLEPTRYSTAVAPNRSVRWTGLMLKIKSVKAIWPTSPVSEMGYAVAARCRQFLEGHMRAGPKKMKKEAYFDELTSEGCGISLNAFEQIWSELAREIGDPSWTAPGRPRKRSSRKRSA